MPPEPDSRVRASGEATSGTPSVVLVTAPDVEEAERIARTLVEDRLAACVNVVPGMVSLYRWEGQVSRSTEVLMIVKSTQEGFETLRRRVGELHPYDTPEILELAVRDGDDRYLRWILDSVRTEG